MTSYTIERDIKTTHQNIIKGKNFNTGNIPCNSDSGIKTINFSLFVNKLIQGFITCINFKTRNVPCINIIYGFLK